MTAWEYMMGLNSVCSFMSRERNGKATNSEIKRWLQNQAIVINGRRIRWDEDVDFPVSSLVLFPKNRKVTLL